jgi:hypothetical protein
MWTEAANNGHVSNNTGVPALNALIIHNDTNEPFTSDGAVN